MPASRRGTKETGYVTAWDWYATFAELAGLGYPTDHRAAAAGLPPIDSISVLPLLLGKNATSPRNHVIIGDTSALLPNGDGKTLVGGVILGDFKLLVGAEIRSHFLDQYTRTGPKWPNSTSNLFPLAHFKKCERGTKGGCLFNVKEDPFEQHNLAEKEGMESVYKTMLQMVDDAQRTVYSPVRGTSDPVACEVAKRKYNTTWGVFLAGPPL